MKSYLSFLYFRLLLYELFQNTSADRFPLWNMEIFSMHEFFFSLSACAGFFFFRWTPLHEFFFFSDKYCLFLTVKSWFIIYVFELYKLFYTHNRSKDTGHVNAKSCRKCTHSERGGSHLEWTASPCIFKVPAFWNSCPTAHHNDAILHSPMKTILCGS